MAIEVRIPTILRTYTAGAKAVEGSGTTHEEISPRVHEAVQQAHGRRPSI